MKTKQVPPKPSPAEVPPRPAAAIPLAARVRHLAWLPIPVLLAAILVFRAAGLGGSYEPHTLRLVLSFTFYTLVSLGTLFLIGRSFLASGRPGLLLLECGVVLWSLAGTGADAVDHGDANINVTIFNTSIFLAALCHLTGAALALRPQRPLRAKPLWLAAGCALALGALALVTRAALGGRMPVFFVPGQGGTPMRYFVLISAIAMFVLSAALLRAGQRAARPPFTSWYALALLLMAVGLFGIMIQLSLGSVVNWLARSAEWLSGVYLLMAALAALRESRLPLLPSAETSRRESYRYAMAVVLVLAATAVRMAFLQSIQMRHVFVTFYPAVMLAALYGGGRAGLLATALSALSADYFWIDPVGTLVVRDSADGAALAVFCISGALLSIIVEAMHRAQKRSAAAEAGAKAAAERALAAEALRESEEKYRTLFENMAEEVHFWQVLRDAGGRIKTWRLVDANPPALRTWGRKSIDEIRGKTTDEIFGPGAKEHYMPVVQKIMTEGVPFSFEDYFPNLDRHFRFTSVPLGDHFITTGADITGIKRAERELFASNQRLEALMRALPVGVSFSDDATCQRITGNPAVLAQFEVTTQDNLSASAPDANAPGRQVRFFHGGQPITDTDLPLQRAVAENRFIAPMDLEVELPSGRRWFTEASGAPIHDAEGKVIGGVAVTVDVTGRKRAEESLRNQAALLDLAHDAIVVRDAGNLITFWNRGAQETYGWTREEAMGRMPCELLKTRFPKPQAEIFAEVAEKGRWDGELTQTCKDGREIVAASRWAAQRDHAGRQVGILEINRDITERKEFQARLERLVAERTAKLQELVGELEHFSYTITHDMRAPLRAMKGFSEVVQELCATCPGQEQKGFLRRIMTSADRMDSLIRDALNYSQAVRQELPLEPVDTGALLRGMLDTYPELQPSEAHIRIEGEIPWVMGNEAGLTQCFSNLLGNAVKFRKPGQTPEVRIWAEQRDRWARIWVEDNGIGISGSMLPRVFDMFSRGHRTHEGTGIGLALVRKVMDRMGGKTGVESEEGKGSRFWLELCSCPRCSVDTGG